MGKINGIFTPGSMKWLLPLGNSINELRDSTAEMGDTTVASPIVAFLQTGPQEATDI